MKCKIITGTKSNCEEQVQMILDIAETIISMDTSPNQSNGIYITIIYIPKKNNK